MNLNSQLIQMIGSPFVGNNVAHYSESESIFNLAFRNRVELLYLTRLKENGALKNFTSQYEVSSMRHARTLEVLKDVSQLLNKNSYPYVIIKTLRDYPANPNDVDILFLGDERGYRSAVSCLKQNGYLNFETALNQDLFCHPDGLHLLNKDKQGGIYYIDLYREAAVQHFIYLDKRNLRKYIVERKLRDGFVAKVLPPEIELALLCLHSVFPTQSYQLEMFYSVLYFLKACNRESLMRFIEFIKVNRIVFPARITLTLTKHIHESEFGNTPYPIEFILNQIGQNSVEVNQYVRNNGKMPHEITYYSFFCTLFLKFPEGTALKSIIKQFVHMLNPKFGLKVFRQLFVKEVKAQRTLHV